VAVDAFLHEQIAFLDIAVIIKEVLDRHVPNALDHIDDALRADLWGRQEARRMVAQKS
jgi:1-deoxy-D-xylulose-5-phosphate reductoisomerase